MNDNEALDQIQDILAEGWCQGAMHKDASGQDTNGFDADRETSCMLGAVELVAEDIEQDIRLRRRLMKGISRLRPQPLPDGRWSANIASYRIPNFNDSNKTTQEDVLLAVKYAKEEE